MPVENLTEDCLELIFAWCGGSPFTLCTLSQVCRRWHALARRPIVWRSLVLDKSSLMRYYRRFLTSPNWEHQLGAVHNLIVSKPYETQRHSHLAKLPLDIYLTNVRHIFTLHLCLAEIALLLEQLVHLKTVQCHAIETWCALQTLDPTTLLGKENKHIEFHFKNVTGFISMGAYRPFDVVPKVETLRVVNLRDEDYRYLDDALHEMAILYSDDDDEQQQQHANQVMAHWKMVENRIVSKYKWIASMYHVKDFTFGFCHVWTAAVWKEALLPICPNLRHLELHGWSQLGPTPSLNQVKDIRRDSEDAMAACLAAATRLKSLVLVDFPISSIVKKTVSATHIRIVYSKSWSEPLVSDQLLDFLEGLRNTLEVVIVVPRHLPFQPDIESQISHPLLKVELFS